MIRSVRRALGAAALVAVAGACVTGCGGGGGSELDQGAVDQAVEQLRDFGLSKDQAACVVDELGPESVIEAGDLIALTESQDYQDAAEACGDGG